MCLFFLQYYCSKHILLNLDFTVTIVSSFLLGIEQSSPEKSKSKTMVKQNFGGVDWEHKVMLRGTRMIFSTTQRSNAGTKLKPLESMLQCFVVLKIIVVKCLV